MDLSFGDCPDHRPLPLDKTRGASHRRSSFSGPSPRSDREVPQLVGGRRRRRGRRWLSVRCRSEALRLAPGVHHADSLLFVPSFVTHARSARGTSSRNCSIALASAAGLPLCTLCPAPGTVCRRLTTDQCASRAREFRARARGWPSGLVIEAPHTGRAATAVRPARS
jgi:hypothetical protein